MEIQQRRGNSRAQVPDRFEPGTCALDLLAPQDNPGDRDLGILPNTGFVLWGFGKGGEIPEHSFLTVLGLEPVLWICVHQRTILEIGISDALDRHFAYPWICTLGEDKF